MRERLLGAVADELVVVADEALAAREPHVDGAAQVAEPQGLRAELGDAGHVRVVHALGGKWREGDAGALQGGGRDGGGRDAVGVDVVDDGHLASRIALGADPGGTGLRTLAQRRWEVRRKGIHAPPGHQEEKSRSGAG